jgi:hypothetical protein
VGKLGYQHRWGELRKAGWLAGWLAGLLGLSSTTLGETPVTFTPSHLGTPTLFLSVPALTWLPLVSWRYHLVKPEMERLPMGWERGKGRAEGERSQRAVTVREGGRRGELCPALAVPYSLSSQSTPVPHGKLWERANQPSREEVADDKHSTWALAQSLRNLASRVSSLA